MLQYLVNGLAAGSVIALVGTGFTLIYATARFFHFAHGAAYLIAAYAAFAAIKFAHWPVALALFAGIAIAVGLGGAMERFLFGHLRRRGASSMILLLASLGLSIAIQNAIGLAFGEETLFLRQSARLPVYGFLGSRISLLQVLMIGAAAATTIALAVILKRTGFGRMVRAVVNDPDLAVVVGVPVDALIVTIFCLGSALAGLAGIISAYDTDLQPMMGFRALLLGIVAAVIGGRGNVIGALLGGLLIGIAQNISVLWISTVWQDALVYLVLVAFLVFRPRGFFGNSLAKDSA